MTGTAALSPFAQAFDLALEKSERSLSWLSQYLTLVGTPVTVAALSYWRSGRSTPRGGSIVAVANIETALELDRGSLLDLLAVMDGYPRPLHDLFPSQDIMEILPRLGMNRFSELRDAQQVATWISCRLRADGSAVIENVCNARAVREPVTQIPMLFWTSHGSHGGVRSIRPMFGIALQGPVPFPDLGVIAGLLRLNRPAQPGESLIYGWRTNLAPRTTRHHLLLERVLDPGATVVLELHCESPPTGHVRQYFVDASASERTFERVVTPVGQRYTATFVDAPAGQCGLEWTYDPP